MRVSGRVRECCERLVEGGLPNRGVSPSGRVLPRGAWPGIVAGSSFVRGIPGSVSRGVSWRVTYLPGRSWEKPDLWGVVWGASGGLKQRVSFLLSATVPGTTPSCVFLSCS